VFAAGSSRYRCIERYPKLLDFQLHEEIECVRRAIQKVEGAMKPIALRYRPRSGTSDRADAGARASSKRVAAYLCAGLVLALCGIASGFAQTRTERALVVTKAAAANAKWDTSLPGKWTYRSYLNRADIMVGADPDPAVKALDPIYGQGNAGTASQAVTALNLVFGEGVMSFDQPSGNNVTGTFDMGGGFVLDLKGTMQTTAAGDIAVELYGTGRPNTPTDNWEYDYKATTTPKWPNGIDQVPTLVGTVIRAKPHGTSKAGFVASFIAIKQQ
jgi:hypothetical protein